MNESEAGVHTSHVPQTGVGHRLMLVADGKPKCGDLPAMAYATETRPLLDGFYDARRERAIKDCIAEANLCRLGTPTYVMTTGYGAVAPNATVYHHATSLV